MKGRLLPSLLSANMLFLKDELQALERAGIDALHLDIMDGHFVPNLTFGPSMVSTLRKETSFWLDVHLMIQPLHPMLASFVKAGAHSITFHVEATDTPLDVIQYIRSHGCSVGVSIKPKTSLQVLESLLPWVDLVLIMTVEPGFGGQTFMREQLEKIQHLHRLKEKTNPHLIIEVDGGITPESAHHCQTHGAQYFVAGTSVFQGGCSAIERNVAAFGSRLVEPLSA